MSDVKPADRLIQFVIGLVHREYVPSSTVGIRKRLGKHIRRLESQTIAKAFFDSHDRGVIGGVTAVVTATKTCVNL